jgi:predicted nucleic acid-binding protein
VLVAAFVAKHSSHQSALHAIQRLLTENHQIVVAAHTIVELYAVLTRLPVRPRIRPVTAAKLIKENVLQRSELITLVADKYELFVAHCAANDIRGGTTYDALIVFTGIAAGVDRILTANVKNFQRVAGKLSAMVISP